MKVAKGLTEKQKEYRRFLQTPFWQELRLKALARDEEKCRFCGRNQSKMDVHHIFYRKDWFETRLEDILTLCRKCHKKEHADPFFKDKARYARTLAETPKNLRSATLHDLRCILTPVKVLGDGGEVNGKKVTRVRTEWNRMPARKAGKEALMEFYRVCILRHRKKASTISPTSG